MVKRCPLRGITRAVVEADNKTIKEIKSGVSQSLYLARRRKLQFHW